MSRLLLVDLFAVRAASLRLARLALFSGLLLIGLSFGLARAQSVGSTPGTIAGRVYNAATKECVPNAEVRVEGTNFVTYSEGAGFYRLTGIPAGTVKIVGNYTGSESVTANLQIGP